MANWGDIGTNDGTHLRWQRITQLAASWSYILLVWVWQKNKFWSQAWKTKLAHLVSLELTLKDSDHNISRFLCVILGLLSSNPEHRHLVWLLSAWSLSLSVCICLNKLLRRLVATQNQFPAGEWVASTCPNSYIHLMAGQTYCKVEQRRRVVFVLAFVSSAPCI